MDSISRSPELGSSPRVRGTPAGLPLRGVQRRFIPACAGNSGGAGRCRWTLAVHPRVCGELPVGEDVVVEVAGSSPRVRGTQREHRVGRDASRFIPACAGNSPTTAKNPTRTPVHPRVCGELLAASRARSRCWRFIPACAGNSPSHPPSSTCRPVHPRVCGELGDGEVTVAVDSRFIPACAGNSSSGIPCAISRTVHPRVCGELEGEPARIHAPGGSSPRVRGTLPGCADRASAGRFIPACAGNSLLISD